MNNDSMDNYAFGAETTNYLRQIGVPYSEDSCPIMWIPAGKVSGKTWDFEETRAAFLTRRPTDTLLARLQETEDKQGWAEQRRRLALVRSQMFVSEEFDKNPQYVIVQPIA